MGSRGTRGGACGGTRNGAGLSDTAVRDAFAVALAALAPLYIRVAIGYGHGWSGLANAVIGLALIFAWIASFAALAWWWSRGWRRP